MKFDLGQVYHLLCFYLQKLKKKRLKPVKNLHKHTYKYYKKSNKNYWWSLSFEIQFHAHKLLKKSNPPKVLENGQAINRL